MSDKTESTVCDTAGHAMTSPTRQESDGQIQQVAKVNRPGWRPAPAPSLPAYVMHG